MASACLPSSDLRTFAPTIVPTFLEAFFFGISVVVYGIAVHTTTAHKQARAVPVLQAANTLALALAFVHVALSLARCFSVSYNGREMTDFALFFADQWEGVPTGDNDYARLGLYVTLALVGDVLMVYRLFATWAGHPHRWAVLLFPVLSVLADAVSGYMLYAATFTLVIFCWTSWFTITLSSALIIGHLAKSQAVPLVSTIASAVAYSVVLLIAAITSLTGSNEVWSGYLVILPSLVAIMISVTVMQFARERRLKDSFDAASLPTKSAN